MVHIVVIGLAMENKNETSTDLQKRTFKLQGRVHAAPQRGTKLYCDLGNLKVRKIAWGCAHIVHRVHSHCAVKSSYQKNLTSGTVTKGTYITWCQVADVLKINTPYT